MSRFRYPVDSDQFQRIREDGKVYVDKTNYLTDTDDLERDSAIRTVVHLRAVDEEGNVIDEQKF